MLIPDFKKLGLPFVLSAIWVLSSAPAWAATAEVAVIQSVDRYPVGGTYPLVLRIKIQSPWYIHGTNEGQDGLIPTTISFHNKPGVMVENVEFPDPQKMTFEYATEPLEVYSGEIHVRATLKVDETASEGRHVIKGSLSFQACSAASCLAPENLTISFPAKIVPRGVSPIPLNLEIFGEGSQDAEIPVKVAGWSLGASLWFTLIGIFLGGLALNLTPCIYPLIPITVSYFGGSGQRKQGNPVLHGLLYILGLATMNSVLGVTVALSGGILGQALQNPLVLILVAGILFSLGLSFFGLWELRVPSGLTAMASRNFGGYLGTAFMGVTLGIVAAPCLGPFILGLLTYVGQKGDPYLGFLYFFVLSIGLGFPLAVLAVFSGSLKRLPMSGEWMVWVKKALGWVLIAMAVYVLRPLIPSEAGKLMALVSIVFFAGVHLGWIDRNTGKHRLFPIVKKSVSALLIVVALLMGLIALKPVKGIQWKPYNEAVLSDAAEKEAVVMLDFYAEWCGPCKALDRQVFTDPEIVALSGRFVTLRADLTKRHPEQLRLQRRFKIRGVPTIIFINRQGEELKDLRIESYVKPSVLLERMKKVLAPDLLAYLRNPVDGFSAHGRNDQIL